MNDRTSKKLKTLLLPGLYVVFIYELYQLLIQILSLISCLQLDAAAKPAMDAELLPMIMGFNTMNLLIYAGSTVKVAALIANLFSILNVISILVLLLLIIKLFRQVQQKHTPFSYKSLAQIRMMVYAYLAVPVIQTGINTLIIFLKDFSLFQMNFIYGSLYGISTVLFTAVIMLCILAVFQHGISLQQEADETL